MGSLLSSHRPIDFTTICEHKTAFITFVKGAKDCSEFWNEITSYKMEFGHLCCPTCNMNCYVYNCQGPYNTWAIWQPKTDEEKIPISKTPFK